jgi:hypothetical protein
MLREQLGYNLRWFLDLKVTSGFRPLQLRRNRAQLLEHDLAGELFRTLGCGVSRAEADQRRTFYR